MLFLVNDFEQRMRHPINWLLLFIVLYSESLGTEVILTALAEV